MANQFFNISYDPSKSGYDNSSWHTIHGDAYVTGGKLRLDKSEIIHYGDILRGDFYFSVKLQTPAIDDNIKIGLIQYSKNAYLYFKIDQGVLTAETSNGVNTTSQVIDWVSDWSDTDTEFRIRWEAGMATFYIGGQFKYRVSDITVPNVPLSFYLASDSTNIFLLDYILGKSIQSFLMSEGNEDSSFEIWVSESDKLTISEAITTEMADDMAVSKVDNVSISESKTATISDLIINKNDDITTTENLTVGEPS